MKNYNLFFFISALLIFSCTLEEENEKIKIMESKSLEEQFLGFSLENYLPDPDSKNTSFTITEPKAKNIDFQLLSKGRLASAKYSFGPKALHSVDTYNWQKAHAIGKEYLERTKNDIRYYHANQWTSLFVLDNFLLDKPHSPEIDSAVKYYFDILLKYENRDYPILTKTLSFLLETGNNTEHLLQIVEKLHVQINKKLDKQDFSENLILIKRKYLERDKMARKQLNNMLTKKASIE